MPWFARPNKLWAGKQVMGGKFAEGVVRAFLVARFTGEERRARRFAKVDALERRMLKS
jgi:ribose 5-phosphate isomerase B